MMKGRIDGEVGRRRGEFGKYTASDWAREAFREKLDGGGLVVPAEVGLGRVGVDPRGRAERLAATIPGVSVGMPGEGKSDDEVQFPETRPWLPELEKWKGREDILQKIADRAGVDFIKFPATCKTMRDQAAWLDQNHPLNEERGA